MSKADEHVFNLEDRLAALEVQVKLLVAAIRALRAVKKV